MSTQPEATLIVYSTAWCGDCRRSKRWLDANNVPYTNINIDEDETAADRVVEINKGSRSVPTIVFPDGSVLVEPSNRALATQVATVMGIVTPDAQAQA